MPGWRERASGLSRPALALVAFWAVVITLVAAAGAWLALHGAPPPKHSVAPPRPPAPVAPPAPKMATPAIAPVVAPVGAPVAAPVTPPAPVPANPHHWPQIGLVVSGLGLSQAISTQAIEQLPAGVTLAFSPYAAEPQPLVDQAKARGHEILLSLPMEPEGAPRNDEGDHQLTLALGDPANLDRLNWALARFSGFDGLTNAEAGQFGDHFAASAGFAAITSAIDQHGLLYVTTLAPLVAPKRQLTTDLTVDAQPDPVDIDARLDRLEALAEAHGCALGIAGPLSPMLVERLRIWATALPARGLLLLPVAAMAQGGSDPCPSRDAPPPVADPIAPPAPPTEGPAHG